LLTLHEQQNSCLKTFQRVSPAAPRGKLHLIRNCFFFCSVTAPSADNLAALN
jgi:hypothetical protein